MMSVPKEGSPTELATLLGLTTQAIGKLTEKGIFRRVARGRYDLTASIVAYIRYRERLAAERAGGDEGSYAQGRTKKIWEEARRAEHERLVREGLFLERESVDRTWKAMIASARSVLLAMPSRLALQLARASSPQACEALVRKSVYSALSRLAAGKGAARDEGDDAAA